MGSCNLLVVSSCIPTQIHNYTLKMRATCLVMCGMLVVAMSLPIDSKPDIKPADDLIPVEHSIEKRAAGYEIQVDEPEKRDAEEEAVEDEEDHDEDDEEDEDDDEAEEDEVEDDEDGDEEEEDDDEDDDDEDDDDDEEEEEDEAEETPVEE